MSKAILPADAPESTPFNRGNDDAPPASTRTSLVEALATVHFGDITSNDYLAAIYAGRDPTIPLAVRSAPKPLLDAAWGDPKGVVVWEGPIPDREGGGCIAGRYIVANPYSTEKVGDYDADSLSVGAGLTDAAVAEITTIAAETDEAEDGGLMPIVDQARLYDGIERDAGITFAAAVLSGDKRDGVDGLARVKPYEVVKEGKSLHVFLAVRACPPNEANLRLRREAVDALVALASSDPACRDLSRKMRFGGVVARGTGAAKGVVRVQTLIRAEPVAYDLQDLRDRLVGLAIARGIDVSSRIEALQFVARTRGTAKAWLKAAEAGTVGTEEATDAAETLRDAALRVRKAGKVLDAQTRIVEAVGRPKGRVVVTTSSGATRELTLVSGAWDPGTTIITHTDGSTGTADQLWNTHLRGKRVPDIHCVGHADAHASAFLTRRKGGLFAVHCPTCEVLQSSPVASCRQASARPTIEEADAAEDVLAGCEPTPEVVAGRLNRDGRYAEVLVLAETVCSPSEAMYQEIEDALAGMAGDERDAAEQLALGVYKDHIADREAAAKVVHPLSLAGAKKAMVLAGTLVAPIRAKLRAQGLPLPDPKKPCGVHLGLHHFGDGHVATMRLPCKRNSCPACGPIVVARRIAAVLCSPITAGGIVVGAPMGDRPLWAFEMPSTSVAGFVDRWREKAYPRLPLIKDPNRDQDSKEEVGDKETQNKSGHAYVTFKLANGRVTVLSTLDVPVLRKTKHAVVGVPVAVDDVAQLVVQLGTDAYRFIPADISGLDDAVGTVEGTVHSSNGLSLDPSKVAQVAEVSMWVSLGPVKAGAVKAALEARNIDCKAKTRVVEDAITVLGWVHDPSAPESRIRGRKTVRAAVTEVERVVSTGYVDPKVAMEVMAEASSRRPVKTTVTGWADVAAIDVDDLLAEIG